MKMLMGVLVLSLVTASGAFAMGKKLDTTTLAGNYQVKNCVHNEDFQGQSAVVINVVDVTDVKVLSQADQDGNQSQLLIFEDIGGAKQVSQDNDDDDCSKVEKSSSLSSDTLTYTRIDSEGLCAGPVHVFHEVSRTVVTLKEDASQPGTLAYELKGTGSNDNYEKCVLVKQ